MKNLKYLVNFFDASSIFFSSKPPTNTFLFKLYFIKFARDLKYKYFLDDFLIFNKIKFSTKTNRRWK